MTFSIVDSFLAGKCVFPERPENALLSAVDMVLTAEQLQEFRAIWFNNRYPLESMIRYLVDNKVPFNCPVCGGLGVRQEWEIVNSVHYWLCDTPCYCQPALILDPRDCTELSL